MLGLKRHIVRLEEHDVEWSLAYEAEVKILRLELGDLVADVQHVGSTAVPGIVAKPIIDIAVAVAGRHIIPEVVRRLTGIGFIARGDSGSEGGYLVVKESEPDVRLAHVHIVELADPQWQSYISFRDVLRRDSQVRREYAALKRRLAEQYQEDRKAYTAGKERFIAKVLNGISFKGSLKEIADNSSAG